jgi:outer membrane lipoprotein carrier protein
MRKLMLAIASFAIFTNAVAQDQDPKAKTILDALSKKTKTYTTITASYTLTTLDKNKKPIDKQDGKIVVKGTKFKLEIPGNNIVCDGKNMWTHMKDANEITIKNFDASADDLMNPTKIFTIYEKGFKYKYSKVEGGLEVIDLFPAVKPEKKKYHTAKLYINKAKMQVMKLVMLMKDGSTQTYEIKSFVPNTAMDDKSFVFDTSKFKPDQITDER